MILHISVTKFNTRTKTHVQKHTYKTTRTRAKEPYNKNAVRVSAHFRKELLLEITYFQQLTNQRYTA